MKTVRLVIGVMVVLMLIGCEGRKSTLKHDPNIADLGSYTILGILDKGKKIVTYYPDIYMVCIQNGSEDTGVYYGSSATLTCWGKNETPPAIQHLVDMYWLRIAAEVSSSSPPSK